MTAGEVVYRGFLGAYGLLFPAYVLYRIVRARRSGRGVPMRIMWLSVLIAAPMFWMGFIEGHTPLLTIGVVIVVAMSMLPREAKRTQSAD